MAMLDPRILTG